MSSNVWPSTPAAPRFALQHSERRSENWAIPSLCRATPSATSEHFVELLGSSPIPRSFVASCVSFQLRLLSSTGVTRLHRYYEPLRHPKRPGLSLASCQLIHTAITAGTSRVALGPHCLHAVANTPAGLMELYSLVRSHQLRPSLDYGLVGSCITRFGACSAFTHVTACTLARSPSRPSAPEASAVSLPPLLLRLLPGGANQFPGGYTPAVDRRLSRRTVNWG
jgi:hypothetical protein